MSTAVAQNESKNDAAKSYAIIDKLEFRNTKFTLKLTYTLITVVFAALIVASGVLLSEDSDQRSFVYQTVYEGPLLGLKSDLETDVEVEMKHVRYFNPQFLVLIPSCLFFVLCLVNSSFFWLRDRKSSTDKRLYPWLNKGAKYMFGITVGWLVTLVMFLSGIRDAGHLITLFIYHAGVFSMFHSSMLGEVISQTSQVVTTADTVVELKDWWAAMKKTMSESHRNLIIRLESGYQLLIYFLPLAMVQTFNYAFTSQEIFEQERYIPLVFMTVAVGVFSGLCCVFHVDECKVLAETKATEQKEIKWLIAGHATMMFYLMCLLITATLLLYAPNDQLREM